MPSHTPAERARTATRATPGTSGASLSPTPSPFFSLEGLRENAPLLIGGALATGLTGGAAAPVVAAVLAQTAIRQANQRRAEFERGRELFTSILIDAAKRGDAEVFEQIANDPQTLKTFTRFGISEDEILAVGAATRSEAVRTTLQAGIATERAKTAGARDITARLGEVQGRPLTTLAPEELAIVSPAAATARIGAEEVAVEREKLPILREQARVSQARADAALVSAQARVDAALATADSRNRSKVADLAKDIRTSERTPDGKLIPLPIARGMAIEQLGLGALPDDVREFTSQFTRPEAAPTSEERAIQRDAKAFESAQDNLSTARTNLAKVEIPDQEKAIVASGLNSRVLDALSAGIRSGKIRTMREALNFLASNAVVVTVDPGTGLFNLAGSTLRTYGEVIRDPNATPEERRAANELKRQFNAAVEGLRTELR